MTRREADELITKYDDATHDYYSFARLYAGIPAQDAELTRLFHKMNALREHILDRLEGVEFTDPLPGRTK